MTTEVIALAIGAGMALLITIKSDQQSISILKGKLFHSGSDQKLAQQTYAKHARVTDVIFATAGLAMFTLSIALFTNKSAAFYVPGVIGLLVAGTGVWGRCKTFIAAERELDNEMGDAG
jgi:hypothetical protein